MEDNNIVDVEYRKVEDLEDETNEQLAGEANTLWSQMEIIGTMGLQMAAEAGKRLTIIKSRLEHGEWETWCKDHLKFSVRKASRMMLLASKIENEDSIFSNRTTLTDIGISKVWALLSAPEEVAEEAVKNQKAAEMSTREFEEEIRRLKAENDTIPAMEAQINELKLQITDSQKSEISQEDMDKLKDKLDKANKKLQRAKDGSEKIAEEAREEGIKAGKELASKSFEKLTKENEEAKATIDKLKKQIEASSNENVIKFKVKSDILQNDFNECLRNLDEVDAVEPETAAKLRRFLTAVVDKMGGQVR
jgi:chromosome segregation ATPase